VKLQYIHETEKLTSRWKKIPGVGVNCMHITEAKIDVWVEYLSLLKLQFLNYQQKNQKIK